jgi:hypothetical protein
MVLDLTLRSLPGSPFLAAGSEIGLLLPCAAGIQNGLCAESATAGHGFLDSGIVLCVFAWKPLAGLRSVALLSAMGTNAVVFF